PILTSLRLSVLVTDRSAVGPKLSVSDALLSRGVGSTPLLPSSETVAVFVKLVTPTGIGLSTVTPKCAVAEVPPPARVPGRTSVQGVPAGEPSAHDQTSMLRDAVNVVFAGTVSVIVTPVAPLL